MRSQTLRFFSEKWVSGSGYDPLGHGAHSELASALEIRPGGQGEHDPRPCGANEPVPHGEQSGEPLLGATCPGPHGVQVTLPTGALCPRGQGGELSVTK